MIYTTVKISNYLEVDTEMEMEMAINHENNC
jgi:hypothetical protein